MVAVVKRMRKLQELLSIRLGKGAAILPPEVTRIHMDFAYKMRDGHAGAKQFWRKCLPRLKYHNPSIPMTVNRSTNQEGPALMTIHFTSPSSASFPPPVTSTTTSQTSTVKFTASKPGSPTERTETINVKMRKQSEILDDLYRLTNAKLVRPTAEEARLSLEIQEQNFRSRKDQLMMQKVNEKRKRDEAILIQARGEVQVARET